MKIKHDWCARCSRDRPLTRWGANDTCWFGERHVWTWDDKLTDEELEELVA